MRKIWYFITGILVISLFISAGIIYQTYTKVYNYSIENITLTRKLEDVSEELKEVTADKIALEIENWQLKAKKGKDIVVFVDPYLYSLNSKNSPLSENEFKINDWNIRKAAPWVYMVLYPFFQDMCESEQHIAVPCGSVDAAFLGGDTKEILVTDSDKENIKIASVGMISRYAKANNITQIYMCGWATNECIAKYSKQFQALGLKTILIEDKSLYCDLIDTSYEDALKSYDGVIQSYELSDY